MPDEHGNLTSQQEKLAGAVKPTNSGARDSGKSVPAAGQRTEEMPLIADKMEQATKLFAEVSEYLEKVAPKQKRMLNEAKMKIGDVGMLLQQMADEEVSGVQRVLAPMPGVIMRCEKKIGQAVEKGDVVLILDAMKMENLITAPVAGKLVSLPYDEGRKVAKGSVLAIISIKA